MEFVVLIIVFVLQVLEGLVLCYFVYTVAYSLAFSLAAFFYKGNDLSNKSEGERILVLIPAYKDDSVIINTANQAIIHNYPKELYDVVVIADSLEQETLTELRKIDRLRTIEVNFEASTKVKALNMALEEINEAYEITVILDSDNIMQEGFLQRISYCYQQGHWAIQGQRMAKNKNTSMAVLDGLSEAINNRIYRQGTTALGLSCSFIGSGMAVNYSLLKETLREMKSVGGFDRDMEVKLIGKGHKVFYLRDAIVLDEKVDNPAVFKNQRKRWIYSQYHYLWSELKPGMLRLFKGDILYFNSAILRNIQLPRLINLGLLFVLSCIVFVFPEVSNFSFTVWIALLALLILSNILAIPRRLINLELLKAILFLPKVFLIMFGLLFRLKGANKKFIHTPHGRTKQ